MDLGRDVLTKNLLGSNDSEKVFTPWWVTLHHYFIYFLVILGKKYSKIKNKVQLDCSY